MRSAVRIVSSRPSTINPRRPLLNDFGYGSDVVGGRRLLRGPSHLDRGGFEDYQSWACLAGYCPLRWPLALCCFKTVRAATSLARLP